MKKHEKSFGNAEARDMFGLNPMRIAFSSPSLRRDPAPPHCGLNFHDSIERKAILEA
jgi:hypothetical protein